MPFEFAALASAEACGIAMAAFKFFFQFTPDFEIPCSNRFLN